MKTALIKGNPSYQGQQIIKDLVVAFYKNIGLEISYENISIVKDSNGKPFLKLDGLNIEPVPYLSISHNDRYVAVDLDRDRPIGIDIETIRHFDQTFRKNFLTDCELEWIEQQPQEEKDLYTTIFWSLKEAYLKAIGTGLRKHPQKVEIRPKNNNIFELFYNGTLTECEACYNVDTENRFVISKVLLKQ